MPRSSSGPFGTLPNLGRLCRAALTIDGLLASGLSWEAISREVREKQYVARGLEPPRQDVVRRYFSLDLAPALDPGFRVPLSYPAALALQYPHVRPMVVAPILDLLFGPDVPKLDQVERKQRFSDTDIKLANDQGRAADAEFMQLLNQIAPGQRRGRASDQPTRPHWSLYQTLLIGRHDLVLTLFNENNGMYSRHIRPIEQEVNDLRAVLHIDSLALIYGLVLEALELTDGQRLAIAKQAALDWLPNLYRLPECRRVAPLIEHAVIRACGMALPRKFSRILALDRVRPGTWREPGPLTSIEELVFSFPDNSDSLQYVVMKELDIDRMNQLIERRFTSRAEGTRTAISFPRVNKEASSLPTTLRQVAEAVPDADTWTEGRFLVIQGGTRCAIGVTGQDSFPLALLDFGHLRGDPVIDRPISAMPWILAEWRWVGSTSDPAETIESIVGFLIEG